jgi:hypothetical protein
MHFLLAHAKWLARLHFLLVRAKRSSFSQSVSIIEIVVRSLWSACVIIILISAFYD